MKQARIVVRGARENNLRGVDVEFPRGSLTTVTGVSGSGKSSLAFDTIHNEGQRRFLESLSSYARQFLGQIEKPDVDHVEGLSPTISIDQKTVNRNPRSTVGTITEIHDLLRLLFARLGTPHCPSCGTPIASRTADEIRDRLLADKTGRDVMVLAPIVKDRKGSYRKELADLRLRGYVRARIDGSIRRLDEEIELERYVRHTIEVVVDRVRVASEKASRLAESIEQALKLGGGLLAILDGDEHVTWSTLFACSSCGRSFPELEPRLFSFNSPHGACPACDGLGVLRDVDPDLVVPDPSLSVREGALEPIRSGTLKSWGGISKLTLDDIARHFGIDLERPFSELPEEHRDVLLYGSDGEDVRVAVKYEGKNWRVNSKREEPIEGLIEGMRRAWEERAPRHLERYLAETTCRDCEGSRLNAAARSVTFRGETIAALSRSSIAELGEFFTRIELGADETAVGAPILKELHDRLRFLDAVGLGYLTIDRSAATLSGGESQRVRLATQVSSRLKGILYVLDEPSIGLHARDNDRLIRTLEELRDLGNTVCVVEHDQEMMERSDWVIDVGPGAGVHGGEIVAAGPLADVLSAPDSVTAAYLSQRRVIAVPKTRREPNDRFLTVRGARENNLQGIDVAFPIGLFTVVSGVSGSGKSSLVDRILKRALAAHFHGARAKPGRHAGIDGLEHLDKVVEIDQSPIGRTPRSNPATYTKVFDLIRDLFAATPEAKLRGYKKGRFSFNVAGGRCEECSGAGVRTISMQFLPDVEVVCDVCGGRRFNPETLDITWRGKTITEVLEMTVEEAAEFFGAHPRIKRILDALLAVGLDYIRLGQPATTLSGGEAQRLKLASELRRPATGKTLYLLDEPTTGLHFSDIEKLLAALGRLVDAGNTVVVIEHNLDVIKVADWVVDLGPEGGAGGGRVVYAGPLEGILEVKESHTARSLAAVLRPKKRRRKKRRVVSDLGASGEIVVEGATLHNLRSVDVKIPTGSFTVVTGPSGSGKTSLAFDTIFAEGQRRFVESLSSYARQFLGRLEKAPVDRIEGLAPAIAINQKNASRNPRSTVATTTEIYDYLRLLFARVGKPHCPDCGQALAAVSPSRGWQRLLRNRRGEAGHLVAPLFDATIGRDLPLAAAKDFNKMVPELRQAGFVRVLLDGEEVRIDEGRPPACARRQRIHLVVDRVRIDPKARPRVLEAIEHAYEVSGGVAGFIGRDGGETWFTRESACLEHGVAVPAELSPRMFSFNSLQGSCTTCFGLGVTQRCDPDLLAHRPDRPLLRGAMRGRVGDFFVKRGWFRRTLKAVAKQAGFDLDVPWGELSKKARSAVMDGIEERVSVRFAGRRKKGSRSYVMQTRWPGLRYYVEKWFHETTSDSWREHLAGVMRRDTCPDCRGLRLKREMLAVTVGRKNIAQVCAMTVGEALEFFERLRLSASAMKIVARIRQEVASRLRFLVEVGLDYLTLDRSAATLSGGEAQRIRLATQIGSGLTGVIYVLDEPTIGLHQRDTRRLLSTLEGLRALGNTVIVVEHDAETIDAASWIVDLGPGAGHHGGRVVFCGSREALETSRESLTAAYLRGDKRFSRPAHCRAGSGKTLRLEGARTNNLRGIDVEIPLGCFVAVTGVSGSGKSSLVTETLVPAVARELGQATDPPGPHDALAGADEIDGLIVVDQSPIGRTPKSNPATYTGVFDLVREVFAATPQARLKGFKPGRFSFNAPGGRCEACSGRGAVRVELNFLADVWLTCGVCRGRRYNSETLTVEYRGKTIADVLDMEVQDALEFFGNHPRIRAILKTLADVGLGYLRLGQPSNTLSGGEAQRIKLSRELSRRARNGMLYVLDEPTTGLHFDDVEKLIGVLHRLVEAGHTVVVIEHDLDVVAAADWVIDLGPEGGEGGGRVVATGTPERVARARRSHTGRFLARRLSGETENRDLEERSEDGIPA